MILPQHTPPYLNSARRVHSVLRLWTSYGQKTNFFRRFPWVLEPYRYHSLDEVQASFEDKMAVLQKPHSTEFSGKGCHRSSKPSGGEDLQIEQPVLCR